VLRIRADLSELRGQGERKRRERSPGGKKPWGNKALGERSPGGTKPWGNEALGERSPGGTKPWGIIPLGEWAKPVSLTTVKALGARFGRPVKFAS